MSPDIFFSMAFVCEMTHQKLHADSTQKKSKGVILGELTGPLFICHLVGPGWAFTQLTLSVCLKTLNRSPWLGREACPHKDQPLQFFESSGGSADLRWHSAVGRAVGVPKRPRRAAHVRHPRCWSLHQRAAHQTARLRRVLVIRSHVQHENKALWDWEYRCIIVSSSSKVFISPKMFFKFRLQPQFGGVKGKITRSNEK